MKKKPLLGLLLAMTGAAVASAAADSSPSATPPPLVILAELRGAIDPAAATYLSDAIHRAEEAHAEAVVVELDTPGGLISSVRQMAQSIDHAQVPVVVFVTPAGAAATSAGALLMLASHVAAMSPGTNIGAAHPVGSSGEDISGVMGEKVLNDTLAFARGQAELRGRPRDLAEAVVAKSRSFTSDEAFHQKLIEVMASSREELLKKLDGMTISMREGKRVLHTAQARIEPVTMTPGQRLLHFLADANLATILMSIGILLIYVEASHPGGIVPGVLGGICLLVAFISFQALPVRDGALALVVLGVALLIAEPFVMSHGAAAAGGILSFMLGLLWLIDPNSTDVRIARSIWIVSGLSLAFLVGVITYAAARMRSLSKAALARMGGGGISGLQGYTGEILAVGAGGMLGTARFRGETWEFESGSGELKVGDQVRAVEMRGMKVKVEKN